MKKIYIILVLFILVINACNQRTSESQFQSEVINKMVQEANYHYDSIKAYFDENLTNHFPEKIDTNNLSISENISDKFDVIRLEVTNKIIKNDLKLFESSYDSVALASYFSTDTCLLIPNRHVDSKSFSSRRFPPDTNTTKKNFRNCNASSYPVPNFWSSRFYKEESECKLSDNFKIYILDAKSGIYYEEDLLAENNYLPDEWESGFSRGVAINKEEKIVIYWLIIW